MSLDLRSWLTGYALGLAGKPLPFAVVEKREPVAYLYNGVQLPALPEWDKVKYPYAYIGQYKDFMNGNTLTACLYLTEKPLVFAVGLLCNSDMNYTTYNAKNLVAEWTLVSDNTYGNINAHKSPAVWSDYDIYEEDSDAIYLAASEPVPVYE